MEKISPIGWNDALISHANGATNKIASGASTRYVTTLCCHVNRLTPFRGDLRSGAAGSGAA
ncbi:hypothetical protein GCM10023176_35130 [Micromonospora coerulea]|uniref:Uncharacterized protein n=1 Tax=Micromonospora coerulea TaxID=47856 RepID=A0ABP8SMW5_9ACTN